MDLSPKRSGDRSEGIYLRAYILEKINGIIIKDKNGKKRNGIKIKLDTRGKLSHNIRKKNILSI